MASLQIIGDVKDKNCILVDDIIDTGGTFCKAAAKLKELGAKSVIAICTHGLLSGDGPKNIENSGIDKLVLTDSIPLRCECSKVEVVSISKLLAEVIQSVVDHSSITSHFKFN